ncbi:hypothetical protein [Streptomyces violaceusniger]|uniref:Uncharacterized protein n=1 Tax=Streptomyces violaceusniger TaxID=68280 RepID=A0A4D4KRU9_STRVO|nr:hypothetical protein SVIO_026740 [Streptomyces violaceusniger]
METVDDAGALVDQVVVPFGQQPRDRRLVFGPPGMSRPYDNERLAKAYEPGNEMSEESLRSWIDLVASYVRAASIALHR